METNHYGGTIIPVDQFEGIHYPATIPMSAGSPPVCSCGWTRFYDREWGRWVELYEHIKDMGEYGSLRHP